MSGVRRCEKSGVMRAVSPTDAPSSEHPRTRKRRRMRKGSGMSSFDASPMDCAPRHTPTHTTDQTKAYASASDGTRESVFEIDVDCCRTSSTKNLCALELEPDHGCGELNEWMM